MGVRNDATDTRPNGESKKDRRAHAPPTKAIWDATHPWAKPRLCPRVCMHGIWRRWRGRARQIDDKAQPAMPIHPLRVRKVPQHPTSTHMVDPTQERLEHPPVERNEQTARKRGRGSLSCLSPKLCEGQGTRQCGTMLEHQLCHCFRSPRIRNRKEEGRRRRMLPEDKSDDAATRNQEASTTGGKMCSRRWNAQLWQTHVFKEVEVELTTEWLEF